MSLRSGASVQNKKIKQQAYLLSILLIAEVINTTPALPWKEINQLAFIDSGFFCFVTYLLKKKSMWSHVKYYTGQSLKKLYPLRKGVILLNTKTSQ